ncbi:MAG: M15 family metallopeptidase [Clostridia bacterium]|nr:M15 family metallopeptidase [Clostridia bacterium]
MKRIICLFLLICCIFISAYGETLPQVLLVNADHPLPEDYAPGELVNLYEQKRHFLLANSSIELERAAFEAANRMFKLAEDEDMNGFILTSGYRSRERQAELYAENPDTAQAPGCSEHETGLAFDVTTRYDYGTFEDTPQFEWLMEHCWEFGFILRYPEGKEEITGIPYESWHYRYVGEDAAKIIHENGWTLEEYCEAMER